MMIRMPSLSTSSSSVSTNIRVHKATSESLVAPDWSMNMDICNYCNSNRWCAKDIVKEIKRRLHHKNSKVQLLTLTLLEMMLKNCGEYIHYQIAERKILEEMIKLVKKKQGDANVKERILSLLDSWQEAFGGPGGKHSQYFRACDELRRHGVHFPPRSQRSVATPSLSTTTRVSPFGFGALPNSSRRLDEAMKAEVESLSSSTLESMRNVLELLDDMLRAVNPNDRMAVREEVIVDLVERSRTNQKKLMQMITTTTDEDLLAQGIEMNDSLQIVLARHDAIASGAPLPKSSSFKDQESFKTRKGKDKSPISNDQPSSSYAHPTKGLGDEDVEDDNELGQLARRPSKGSSTPSQSVIMGSNEDDASSSNSNSNALVLIDASAPTSAPTSNSKEQDLIDLLSIVLTTSSAPNGTPQAPTSATEDVLLQEPMNNYIVPWAQPQPQPQSPQMLNAPNQFQNQYQQVQPHMQPQCQMMGYSQYSSGGYLPAPWEVGSGYSNNQNFGSNPLMSQGNMNGFSTWSAQNCNSYQGSQYGNNQPMFGNGLNLNPSSMQAGMRSSQQANSLQYPNSNGNIYPNQQGIMSQHLMPTQGSSAQSLPHVNSYLTMATNGLSVNGNPSMNGNTLMTNGSNDVVSSQHKPCILPCRLFEEIGSTEGKMKSGPYPSVSEKPNQKVVANSRSQLNLLD